MSLQNKVEQWDSSKYGQVSKQNIGKKLTSQGYDFIEYTFSPGTNFPKHTHSYEKKDSIASGRFLFGMDGEEIILEPGQMIIVPKDKVHYAKVIGNEDVIFFDATKK